MSLETAHTIQITSLTPGDTLKIEENGYHVNYIYLGEAYSNAIVIRDTLTVSRRQNSQSSGSYPVDYENNYVDSWLTTTFLGRFSSDVVANLALSEINSLTYDGAAGSNTISRSVFLLSAKEAGLTSTETGVSFLNALKTAKNTISATTARISRDSGGTAQEWWLRSAYTSDSNRYQTILASGVNSYAQQTTAKYLRPALSLKKSTMVTVTENGYIL